MPIHFNNTVSLDNFKFLLKNKKKHHLQIGGSDKKVTITFMYKKNYKINSSLKVLTEQFNKLYIVFDNFTTYEMRKHIIEGYYSVTISLDANKIHQFKFCRDDKLEYLDEDSILQKYHSTPADDNKADFLTRWRWICPRDYDDLQIYFFTYYIPIVITNNIDIQDERSIKTVDKIEIKLKKISIGPEDKKDDAKYYKKLVLLHNLGKDISIEVPTFDIPLGNDGDLIVERYNDRSCRNENMLEYFQFKLLSENDVLKTQLDFLESSIVELANYAPANKEFLQLRDQLGFDLPSQFEPNTYHFDQMVFYGEVVPEYHEYNIKIDGLDINISINIAMKINPLYNEIITVLDSFRSGLSNIKSDALNSFPLELYEYNEFILNYVRTCRLYFEKWLVLNILFQNRNSPNVFPAVGPTNEKVTINGNSYISTDLNSAMGANAIIDKLNTILSEFTTSFPNNHFSTINLATHTSANPYRIYKMNTDCLYNPKTTKFFKDINHKFLLNLAWIDRNILSLVYNMNKTNTPKMGDYEKLYRYTLSVRPANIDIDSPIGLLQKIITENTAVDTFYRYLNKLFQIGEKVSLINDTNKAITVTKIDTTTHIGSINSIIVDRTFTKFNVAMLVPFNLNNIPTYLIEKIKNANNSIDLDSIDKISKVLTIYEKQIRSFAKGYWINTEEIKFNDFIAKLSPINRVKLYYKLLFIYTLIERGKILDISIDSLGIISINSSPIAAVVKDRPSSEFYELLNTNETLLKLLQIARFYLINGQIYLKTNKKLIGNRYFDLTEINISKITNYTAAGDDTSFDDATNFGIINFDKITLSTMVTNIFLAIETSEFQEVVKETYDSLSSTYPILKNITTLHLRY